MQYVKRLAVQAHVFGLCNTSPIKRVAAYPDILTHSADIMQFPVILFNARCLWSIVFPAGSAQLAVQLLLKQLHRHVLKHCNWFVPADAFAEALISYYTVPASIGCAW